MRLLVLGYGYTGRAIAAAADAAGHAVAATVRRLEVAADPGVTLVPFASLREAVADCTHMVATVPPGPEGDPALAAAEAAIRDAPVLRWIGYLSTTGVYGDRGGGWVDETTEPAPGQDRSRRRLVAETAWRALADRRAVDIFRLAGIYGPGRSVLDELRAGTARHIVAPDHLFSRIHRDDIVRAVLRAVEQAPPPGVRVFNLCDDEPAASADVLAEAARLLRIAPPPARTLAEAWPDMSPMARPFWRERRRVSSAATRARLGLDWLYPTYREGLRAILDAEDQAASSATTVSSSARSDGRERR